jgi:hypothetical protein
MNGARGIPRGFVAIVLASFDNVDDDAAAEDMVEQKRVGVTPRCRKILVDKVKWSPGSEELFLT